MCAVAALAVVGVVVADTPTPTVEPAHFSHASHASFKTARGATLDTLDPKSCNNCHSLDAKGGVKAPAAQGHAPCLQSKCHGDDPLTSEAPSFFAISEKNSKNKDPKMVAAFTRASAFCLGCHEQVPWPWQRPTARLLDGWVNQREHHIEMARTATSTMDHYAHTQQKKKSGEQVGCRDCHAVGADFKLVKGAPGHAQCVNCHNTTDGMAFAMTDCGKCHKSGSRSEWLVEIAENAYTAKGIKKSVKDAPARMKADVFSCGSQGEAQLAKKGKKAHRCFKHETPEHREKKGGTEVQCQQCHWMVSDKRGWVRGASFSNLAELHTNKIIGDPTTSDLNKQHAACGGCHPHKAQIELATAQCEFCHAVRTSQEPYW